MNEAIWIVATYLLGSIPFGLVVSRLCCGVDPRTAGSGNIGATNVARLCGLPYGIATLVLDVAKGFGPVLAARMTSGSWRFVSLVLLAALAGHMFPIFLRGRGGKGVATTIGVFLAAAPVPAGVAVACCVAVIAATGYVSAGSLVLAVSMPFLCLALGPAALAPAAGVAAVVIIWKHRENIARLRSGQEKSWRKRH